MKPPFRSIAAAIAVAVCTAGTAAQALTLNFDQYLTGDYLGSGSIATLEANDITGGLEFSLTNNAVVGGIDTFITQLFMNNNVAPTVSSFTNVAGPGVNSVTSYASNQNNAGFAYDILVAWDTSNSPSSDRLNIGETSTWRMFGNISEASLFSVLDELAMIHVQGLRCNTCTKGSTKYVATLSEVPLPASALLLLGGLGALGAMRSRRKTA